MKGDDTEDDMHSEFQEQLAYEVDNFSKDMITVGGDDEDLDEGRYRSKMQKR